MKVIFDYDIWDLPVNFFIFILPIFFSSSPSASISHATGPGSFYFLAFFQKIFSNMLLAECLQKIDPHLGAVVIGAKVTQHDASPIGAKIVALMHDASPIGAKIVAPMHMWS
jgi:hypothetical protein